MGWTQEKITNTINEMQVKAATDASFRESIKADPKAAIEKIADLQVPAGFKINVADLNDAELTIVLPKMKSDELSDSDLEAVAGGCGKVGSRGEWVSTGMGVETASTSSVWAGVDGKGCLG